MLFKIYVLSMNYEFKIEYIFIFQIKKPVQTLQTVQLAIFKNNLLQCKQCNSLLTFYFATANLVQFGALCACMVPILLLSRNLHPVRLALAPFKQAAHLCFCHRSTCIIKKFDLQTKMCRGIKKSNLR